MGTIPGYEFVRTMIDENEPVMTHIFRKVSGTTNTNPVAPVTPATPVKPDTNGGSGQDTPAPTPAPTTPIPDAVTPNADQVDTQTTVDNGAKSNDSQNVLPNTGTESNSYSCISRTSWYARWSRTCSSQEKRRLKI